MARMSSLVACRATVAIACCAALLAGCTMCPDPYDYSGPVPNGSAPQNDFRARSNGIAPIDAAPRPWPPLVRKEGKPAEDDRKGPAVQVAGATAEMVAEPEAGDEPADASAPAVPPAAGESAEVVAVVGEEPVAGEPGDAEPASGEPSDADPVAGQPGGGAADDGWRPRMFR